jgi:hypothetical protein
MDQGDLFDAGEPIMSRVPEQLVRPNDPETSHEAAEHIVPTLRELQERVRAVFLDGGEMTQHALIDEYRHRFGWAPESTIRTRCSELVDAGLVVDTLKRVKVGSGRNAVVWKAV